MKKLLACSVVLLSYGFVFGSQLEKAVGEAVEIAQKNRVEDLVFADLYYMLHSLELPLYGLEYGRDTETYKKWDKTLNNWNRSPEASDAELRKVMKEINKKDTFEVGKEYGHRIGIFSQMVYARLFAALAQDGKVVLKYGPAKGTVVTTTAIKLD